MSVLLIIEIFVLSGKTFVSSTSFFMFVPYFPEIPDIFLSIKLSSLRKLLATLKHKTFKSKIFENLRSPIGIILVQREEITSIEQQFLRYWPEQIEKGECKVHSTGYHGNKFGFIFNK